MEASFEDFVLTRGDALLRFAVMLCGDRGRAEDLVQTVLIISATIFVAINLLVDALYTVVDPRIRYR